MRTKRCFAFLPSVLLLLLVQLEGCTLSREKVTPEMPAPYTTDLPESQIAYRSSEYGFSFSLPASWEGFLIRNSTWEGLKSGDQGDVVVEQGSIISIVHPESRTQQPRQDIPIMIFTMEQWDRMQQGEWHIGAAPIGPLELGRNSCYVLALPARYNYAFPEGWEEVEHILQSDPIVTYEPGVVP